MNGLPDPFPSLYVSGNGDYGVATSNESYAIGLGQTATRLWVSALSDGEAIDDCLEWYSINGIHISMWATHPVSGLSNGPWYSSGVHYMAIRQYDKYGWVKLDLTDIKNPMILVYSMQ